MTGQRTEEWFRQRAGKVTASRIADVMAKTKSGWAASRHNYMAQLITERLTGQCAETYTNAAMQWGVETEPQARAAYEFLTDNPVEPVGFIDHPDIEDSGASPDGLVSDSGLVEIKCPNSATHLDTIITEAVPRKYVLQMQWQMACTGREWCDFASFDPRVPEEMHLFVKRIRRDDDMVSEIESAVREFLAEMEDRISALRSKYQLPE